MVSKSPKITSASLSRFDDPPSSGDIDFSPETQIGFWFLGTRTWTHHVQALTLTNFEKLIPERRRSYSVVFDAGCGQGNAFRLLIERFAPNRLIAMDAEEKCIRQAARAAAQEAAAIEVEQGDRQCECSDGLRRHIDRDRKVVRSVLVLVVNRAAVGQLDVHLAAGDPWVGLVARI
ncbi:MAG: methyltransferase domain-containing protein [Deltaproteobacteria bacterium]|nr:methyltransferase domain-containing protein [Deltaproteobacteria bacterium]